MEVKQRGESLRSSERVEPEEFSRRVSSKLGEGISGVELHNGQVWAAASPGTWVEAFRTLRDDPELSCDYLTLLSAIDWRDAGFEVVAIAYSTRHEATVRLKVAVGKEDARVPSLTSVYRGASWHERVCAEMFGITFDGHPALVKLYLPADFEGHPLLKSFKLASRSYKPWPGAKDPGEATAGGRG